MARVTLVTVAMRTTELCHSAQPVIGPPVGVFPTSGPQDRWVKGICIRIIWTASSSIGPLLPKRPGFGLAKCRSACRREKRRWLRAYRPFDPHRREWRSRNDSPENTPRKPPPRTRQPQIGTLQLELALPQSKILPIGRSR